MEKIFLKVLDMSQAATLIIVIVFFARILLKRFPKNLSYLLWGVVLFRLLCPITLESAISPIPNFKPMLYEYISEKDAVLIEENGYTVLYTEDKPENVPEMGQTASMQLQPEGNTKNVEVSWQEMFIRYGKYVWILGLGIMLLYSVISVFKMHRKTLFAIPLKENIYIMDEAISPFVMGILKPRIYLPRGLSEKEQEYITLHEKFHIRRFDYVVKPVAFVALCIHWFNPFVWIAFALFCKDMEMSCDEAVIAKLGEGIRADYSASLLALSSKHRIIYRVPVDFGKGNTKDRIKNLATFRKTRKGVLAVLSVGIIILIVCLAFTHKPSSTEKNDSITERLGNIFSESEQGNINVTENEETPDKSDSSKPITVSLDISKQYVMHTGDPSNFYFIDDAAILWGSGKNEYGQLGQGTQDYDFHSERVKIADNVIHVDYSKKGFSIFLTEDNKLYGMGNAGSGALQQYSEFDWTQYINGENYTVTMPVLLMEDVVYACCGRDDIVCLKEDGTVWTWGTVYISGGYLSNNVYFLNSPQKILENAVLVTGGWFNHAALLRDGTVWTWGYNSAGNCGVADFVVINEPTMVAEDVVMVWTDLSVAGYPQPNLSQIKMAWTKSLKYHTEYRSIEEFGDVYPRYLNNTVIQKSDGSYWVCGENVGTEEKIVAGAEGNYTIVSTHEFYPCK